MVCTRFDICEQIAQEILGWENKAGFWIPKKNGVDNPEQYAVAEEGTKEFFDPGYFRPDVQYFDAGVVTARAVNKVFPFTRERMDWKKSTFNYVIRGENKLFCHDSETFYAEKWRCNYVIADVLLTYWRACIENRNSARV